MQYIGNIITKSKNINTFELVNIVRNNNNLNTTVPNLVIGKELAETLYGKDKVKVLDKKIDNNVYWTFGKLERRNEFENDIALFHKYIVKKLLKSVDYKYINVFSIGLDELKFIINDIKTCDKTYTYVYKDHIYLLSGKNVYGLSLSVIDYVGIGRKRIRKFFKTLKNNEFITNTDFFGKKIKQYIGDNKIIVPYLYFLYKN